MSKIHRAFAFLFLVLLVANVATPVAFNENIVSNAIEDTSFELAATDYNVDVRVYNYQSAFNDDDFKFKVLNGSLPLNGALIRLYNVTTGLYAGYQDTTDGNGDAEINNLQQGTYLWNVTHSLDPLTPGETGLIVSDGPEAIVHVLFGNIDWENDEDDLNATITDIDGNPAQNLNFSIHRTSDNSIYAQVVVTG
jgi:hypothetical protein